MFFTPRTRETVWLAVARAVRTPSRADSDALWNLSAPPGTELPGQLRLVGNPDIESEVLTAFELGYRVQPIGSLVVDLALFHNEYDDIVSGVSGTPFLEEAGGGTRLVIPLELVNGREATANGAELELRWQPTRHWELDLAYTAVLEEFAATDATESPVQQVAIRSLLDVSRSVELDLNAFWVDRLPTLAVDDYLRLDVRLGWRLRKGIEASIGARNLGGRHYEFAGGLSGSIAVEMEPQLFGRVTLQW
jgi:iron complex outermembrane receptor protein